MTQRGVEPAEQGLPRRDVDDRGAGSQDGPALWEEFRSRDWPEQVAHVAAGLGALGCLAFFSVGIPLLILSHVLLVIAMWRYPGPWSRRARAAGLALMIIWWPITLLASAGAAPVLLAWAACRRILVRRVRAWDGPAWPKPVIAAAIAAGAAAASALWVLLSN